MRIKMALWPWVVCLKITVHKGIGTHSTSQSLAMNFDRSSVSLRLNMEKLSLIMLTSRM